MADIGCLDLQVQYYVERIGKYHCHHLDRVGKYFLVQLYKNMFGKHSHMYLYMITNDFKVHSSTFSYLQI